SLGGVLGVTAAFSALLDSAPGRHSAAAATKAPMTSTVRMIRGKRFIPYSPAMPPLDKNMAEGAGRSLRHGLFYFLIVEQFDVTQMARRIARPPDAVRVGWIQFNPSRI